MYKITNIDDIVKVFKTDAELTNFARRIAVENEDEDLSITCIGEAKDYFENYCPDLELEIFGFETTELCPHCDTEQIINDVVQPCPNCNEPLVACSMCNICLDVNTTETCEGCNNGGKFSLCEFDEETGCIIDNEGE
jgi:hypothetical protein